MTMSKKEEARRRAQQGQTVPQPQSKNRSEKSGDSKYSALVNAFRLCEKSILDHEGDLTEHEERISSMEDFLGRYGYGRTEQETKSETPKPKEDPKPQPEEQKYQRVNTGTALNGMLVNGPMLYYKYWDYETGSWAGPKRDLFAAKAAGNGTWEPVWVWMTNGKIDHVMTKAEIEKYCP